jgi:ATP-binding cassette subfamily F protein 3
MAEISLYKIEKFYGSNKILDDITFEINKKDRIGLLGRNGAGKTTVFKIINDEEPYDGGELFKKKSLKIGYLKQIPDVSDDINVLQIIKSGFSDIYKISNRLKETEMKMETDHSDEIIESYHKTQTEYELAGGYELDEKISRIMTGLSIREEIRNRSFNNLSGGEKTRVSLARLLLSNPDILLLDEPTNHLDLPAVEWLESYLSKYSGSVIIISHDRYFLDMTVNKIVEIENRVSNTYKGNYTAFEAEKKRLLIEKENLYKKEEQQLKSLTDSYESLKRRSARNNKFQKRAESIGKTIEKIKENRTDKPLYEKELKLSIENKKFSGKEIIKIENLKKSYNGNQILKGLDFMLHRDEAACILGANGSGKTTILNIITEKINADSGYFKLGNSVNYVYMEQETCFDNENRTVLETITEKYNLTDGEGRARAAKFMFKGDDAFKLIKNLSGGERKRLSLCLLLDSDKNLLILDEPTNHLDIASRQTMEDALENYQNTMLFISHDRYFINKFAGKTYELSNGRLKKFDGNYDFYKKEKQKMQEEKQIIRKESKTKSQLKRDEIKKEQRNKKKKEKIEKEIYEKEKILKNLEKEMNNNCTDHEKLLKLQNEISDINKTLEKLYEKWC